MVTLKGHKRCDHQDPENPDFRCYRQPSFNFFGSVGGIFCHQHKVGFVVGARHSSARVHRVTPLQMPGMVNVVNKCCEHEGCVKRPSFNFPNVRPARFCGQVHVAALRLIIFLRCSRHMAAPRCRNGVYNYWVSLQAAGGPSEQEARRIV